VEHWNGYLFRLRGCFSDGEVGETANLLPVQKHGVVSRQAVWLYTSAMEWRSCKKSKSRSSITKSATIVEYDAAYGASDYNIYFDHLIEGFGYDLGPIPKLGDDASSSVYSATFHFAKQRKRSIE
jgi:hypothetical protein